MRVINMHFHAVLFRSHMSSSECSSHVFFVVMRRKSVFHRCVDLASSSGFNGTEAAHEEEEEAVHEIDEERCHADILMASH